MWPECYSACSDYQLAIISAYFKRVWYSLALISTLCVIIGLTYCIIKCVIRENFKEDIFAGFFQSSLVNQHPTPPYWERELIKFSWISV